MWNVYERNFTQQPRCAIEAATKADAEVIAFELFNRLMDVDLKREDK